jgi:hypothetical protein
LCCGVKSCHVEGTSRSMLGVSAAAAAALPVMHAWDQRPRAGVYLM